MEQQQNAQNNSQQNGSQGNNGSGSAGGTGSGGGAVWFESFTKPEVKSYTQKKGFESAESAVESYMNLEKLAGGDRKNLVKLPDDLSSQDMTPIWERLGRPKEAKEYTFELSDELKAIIPEEDLNQTKEFFLKNNFTRKQAEGFMKMYLERLQGQIKTGKENAQSKVSEDTKALEKAWGQAFKENQNIVSNTVKKLGVSDQEWQAMQNSLGFKRAHDLIYDIGKGTKEAEFHGGKGSGSGASTPNDARNEIQQLMRDKDFVRRLGSGDVEAKKRWNQLHEAANPGEMTI